MLCTKNLPTWERALSVPAGALSFAFAIVRHDPVGWAVGAWTSSRR